jgi:hypothetical protein
MTEFDVAISFAGEQRAEAEAIADCLTKAGLRVFYDGYEVVDMWGKNLYDHLSDVYQNKAEYCLMLVSRHYAEKVWPNHERKSAQARALSQREEYLLPVRFDNTEIPGLLPTIAYLNFQDYGVPGICKALLQKLGRLGSDPRSEWNSFHEELLVPPLLNVDSAENLLGTLNTQSFFATWKTAEGEFRAPNYLRLIAIPRPTLSVRLDRVVQKRFKQLIRSTFPDAGSFDQEVPRGQFYQIESHDDRRSSTHRVWIVWSSGAIGYTANLIPHHPATEVPVGDLACDHIFFSRLAQQILFRAGRIGACLLLYAVGVPQDWFQPALPTTGR